MPNKKELKKILHEMNGTVEEKQSLEDVAPLIETLQELHTEKLRKQQKEHDEKFASINEIIKKAHEENEKKTSDFYKTTKEEVLSVTKDIISLEIGSHAIKIGELEKDIIELKKVDYSPFFKQIEDKYNDVTETTRGERVSQGTTPRRQGPARRGQGKDQEGRSGGHKAGQRNVDQGDTDRGWPGAGPLEDHFPTRCTPRQQDSGINEVPSPTTSNSVPGGHNRKHGTGGTSNSAKSIGASRVQQQ